MNVSDESWGGESAHVFKVFTFAGPDGDAVLLQDCTGREDALEQLAAG